MNARRQAVIFAGIVGLLLGSLPATAQQQNFRVTYSVDRANPAQTRVTGWVFNDARFELLDVYVTAEALDAGGKIVARGIAFVAASIPERGNARFSASVPAPAGASTFRVYVSAFRPGLGLQSP